MKKSIFTYGLIFTLIALQTACKPKDENTTPAEKSNSVAVANEPEAMEIISKDGKVKLSSTDFIFVDKLDDPEFIKENPIDGITAQDKLALYQISSDNVLLSAIQSKKLSTVSKDSIEKKLTSSDTLADVVVNDVQDKEKGVNLRYHYSFTNNNTTINESCSVLAGDYLVCATGDKDFILLDRLIESAQIVKTK